MDDKHHVSCVVCVGYTCDTNVLWGVWLYEIWATQLAVVTVVAV